jgi:uncharacterized protein
MRFFYIEKWPKFLHYSIISRIKGCNMPENIAGYLFELASDNMSVSMSVVEVMGPTVITTMEEAQEKLKSMGVVFGIDKDLLQSIFQERQTVHSIKIAQGKPPVHGKDGRLDFAVAMDSKPKFIPDPDAEKIDWREAVRVQLVKSGDLVAKIIPPTKGVAGISVLGNDIRPHEGNPTRFVVGDGVEQKEDEILATVSGVPNNKSNHITVREVYEVHGNVDFDCGNIHFPGTVIIHGDVMDGFSVQAGEDLIVKGLVNAATLHSSKNIQIFGGILGREKAKIQATGNVEALFVDKTEIVADGDIVITKNCTHSQLRSLCSIKVGSTIVGGRAAALKSVEVSELGSGVGVKTNIAIRSHYKHERLVANNKAILEQVKQVQKHYVELKSVAHLSPKQVSLVWSSFDELKGLIQQKKTIDMQIDKFEKMLDQVEGAQVNVALTLYSDVTISAPHCKTEYMEILSGKMTISEDINSGEMKVHYG